MSKSVQIVGGPDWKNEVQRRIAEGRKRLRTFMSSEFESYTRRVLGDRYNELVGNP